MKETLEYILKQIVNYPDEISVEELTDDKVDEIYPNTYNTNKITLLVSCNKEDIPIIIGKGGRTIKSLRNIIKINAVKSNLYVDIQIKDDEPKNAS